MALALPKSPHRLLYRELVRVWRADKDLADAVKTWFVWDGSVADRVPFGLSLCPSVAALPGRGSDRYYGPSGFDGTLTVDLTIVVAGTNVDDLLDLYHALQRALWPSDPATRAAIREGLRALGAVTGEAEFIQPKLAPSFDDAGPYVLGLGQARLLLETINP